MQGTPYPPDEICDFREAAALLDMSEFTLRTGWQAYDPPMPFFLINGRRAAMKDALIQWRKDRAQAKADHAYRAAMAGRV